MDPHDTTPPSPSYISRLSRDHELLRPIEVKALEGVPITTAVLPHFQLNSHQPPFADDDQPSKPNSPSKAKHTSFSAYNPIEHFPAPLHASASSNDLDFVGQYIAPPGGADLWGLSKVVNGDASSSSNNSPPTDGNEQSRTQVLINLSHTNTIYVNLKSVDLNNGSPDGQAIASSSSPNCMDLGAIPGPRFTDSNTENNITKAIDAPIDAPSNNASPPPTPNPQQNIKSSSQQHLPLEERAGWFLPLTFTLGYCIPALLSAGRRKEKTTTADFDGLVTIDKVGYSYNRLRQCLWPTTTTTSPRSSIPSSKASTPVQPVNEPFTDFEMKPSTNSAQNTSNDEGESGSPLLPTSPLLGSERRPLRTAILLSVSSDFKGLLAGIINSGCPLVMVAILDFVTIFINSDSEPTWHGYGYAAIALGLSIAQGVAQGQIGRSSGHMRAKIHGSLCLMLMEKLCEDTTSTPNLVAPVKSPVDPVEEEVNSDTKIDPHVVTSANEGVKSTDKSEKEDAPIIQLVTSDVEVIAEMVPYLLFGTLNMIDIIASFIYLLIVVGWPGLFPIAVFIILVPVNKWISNRFVAAYEFKATAADDRSRKVEEVLSFIRTVKYYAWEQSMERDIAKLRNTEVGYLKRLLGYLMTFSCIVAVAAPLMQLSLFVAIYLGPANQGRLDSTVIYQSIALISSASWNLSVVPYQVSEWSRVSVSIRRVERFLFKKIGDPSFDDDDDDDADSDANGNETGAATTSAAGSPTQDSDVAGTIILSDVAFTHQFGAAIEELEGELHVDEANPQSSPTAKLRSDSFLLRVPQFRINPGELILVVGKVGSGKSSLMAALLGQMVSVGVGSLATAINRPPICNVIGKISIVPQSPWILNGTVRNNIILDSLYDEARYKRVLVASALAVDLALFANGDATVVGAKGATLSGGQRQRISIARALYRDADIYVFDDSLSALDATVGKQVFEKAINLFLAGKTRIVVTHQLGLLPKADRIFSLGDGLVTFEIMPESVSADPEPDESPLAKLLRGWRLALELLAPVDFISQGIDAADLKATGEGRPAFFPPYSTSGVAESSTPMRHFTTHSSMYDSSERRTPLHPKSKMGGFSPSVTPQRHPTLSPSAALKSNPFSFRSEAVRAAEAQAAAEQLLAVSAFNYMGSRHQSLDENDQGIPGISLPTPAYVALEPLVTPKMTLDLSEPTSAPEGDTGMRPKHYALSCATSGQTSPQVTASPPRSSKHPGSFHFPLLGPCSVDSTTLTPQHGPKRMPTLLLLGALDKAQEEGDKLEVVASALNLSRLPPLDTDALSMSLSDIGSSAFALSRPQSPVVSTMSKPSPTARRPKREKHTSRHGDDDALGSGGFALKAGTSPSRVNTTTNKLSTSSQETEGDDSHVEALTSTPIYVSLFRYLRCVGGVGFWSWMLLLHFATVAFSVWATWWLGRWAEGDSYGLEESSGSLAVMGVYAAALVVSAVIVLIRELLWRSGAVRPPLLMYASMTSAILAAPISFFDTNPLGRVLTRFTRDSDQVDYAIPTATNELLVSVAAQVGALAAICITLPYFTPVAAVILIVVPLLRPSQSLVVLRRVADVALSPVIELFTEAYSGGASIAVLQLGQLFRLRLQKALDNYNAARYMDKIAFEFVRFRVAITMSIVGAGVIVVMTILRDSTSPATAGFVISQTIQIANFVTYMVEQLGTLTLSLNSVARVTDYGALGPEQDGTEIPPPDWPMVPKVEFQNVNAQYRPDLPVVIRDLSLCLAPGERIGVCGRTGSGKSTLIQCLLRMVPTLEGSHVIIDGLDTANLKLSCLRRRMTIIPQEPVIFEGSVRYNLDPVGEHTDERLMAALVECHALSGLSNSDPSSSVKQAGDSVVVNTSSVLDVQLTQDLLSLGQKQLLCLARAVLRGTNVLILDEATSSVDTVTDHLIQSVIRTVFKNCTVLTIAHRINTIIDSDRVLVLDKGAMIEFDEPAKLIKNPSSMFAHLVRQSIEEEQ